MRGRASYIILMGCSGMMGNFWIICLLGMTVSCIRGRDLRRMWGRLKGGRQKTGKIGPSVFNVGRSVGKLL